MLKVIRSLRSSVERMGLVGGVLASLLATLLASVAPLLFSSVLHKIKNWQPFFNTLFPPTSIFLINVIAIFLLVFLIISINRRIQVRGKEPDLIFAKSLIFRKVSYGPRTQVPNQKFALSVKIGIKNDVDIFDTRMTLLYMYYKKNNDNKIERHGVEEFVTTASYVSTVHRYSFYSDELSFRLLESISEARGKQNDARIVMLLTGFYGKGLNRFVRKYEYLVSSKIEFADQTPKVVECTLGEDDKLIKTVDWGRFHEIVGLSDDETERRVSELKQIVKDMEVKS